MICRFQAFRTYSNHAAGILMWICEFSTRTGMSSSSLSGFVVSEINISFKWNVGSIVGVAGVEANKTVGECTMTSKSGTNLRINERNCAYLPQSSVMDGSMLDNVFVDIFPAKSLGVNARRIIETNKQKIGGKMDYFWYLTIVVLYMLLYIAVCIGVYYFARRLAFPHPHE